MREFSPAERQRLIDVLDRAGAATPCSRCGNEELELAGGYITEHVQAERGHLIIRGDNMLPSIAMICSRCGYIAQHALSVLERHDAAC